MSPQLSLLQACLTSLSLVGCLLLPARAEEVPVFHDSFDNGLAEGWEWIREHGAHWCVRDGALEIRVVPGLARTVQNALVRKLPGRGAAPLAIEVDVTNLSEPTQQYEQAGITLYQDDRPVFKFVKELVDGQMMMIPGRKAMGTPTVRLRLIVTADTFTAQYRPAGKDEFLTAASGALPPPGNDRISIQCYNGPPDREHWIRFDNFRIVRLNGAAETLHDDRHPE